MRQTKGAQLQIRVTASQKTLLRRRAAAAGMDVSAYVLARALPAATDRFADLVRQLARADRQTFVLAELNDFLTAIPASAFDDATADSGLERLSPYVRNYVTAMVEQAAHMKGVNPPAWTRDVAPLEEPRFVGGLRSLRLHLLRNAPIPFKRRNIFVDATVGDRV